MAEHPVPHGGFSDKRVTVKALCNNALRAALDAIDLTFLTLLDNYRHCSRSKIAFLTARQTLSVPPSATLHTRTRDRWYGTEFLRPGFLVRNGGRMSSLKCSSRGSRGDTIISAEKAVGHRRGKLEHTTNGIYYT